MVRRLKQRGDTLTEVMFATAVAALVIVLGMSVMNRSLAQTQLAVETTFVRQAIDSEAEILRYSRDAYKNDPGSSAAQVWKDVIDKSKSQASSFGTCDLPINGQFFIPTDDLNDLKINTNVQPSETFATVGQGLWVEAVAGSSVGSIKYLDLHIRACWQPPFDGPESTLGTIVRLYYE